jgi:catechol 2,3-dioxygenase-like lactoylglutathione lyase family enzyme
MIAYVTLGTTDVPRAAAFYDQVLALLGAKRQWQGERGMSWGTGHTQPGLGVTLPFDGQAASVGNGVMVSLSAPDHETVNRVHALALQLGGQDEGAPGPRGGFFHAAYFRDMDGNKLMVCCPLKN